MQFDSEAAVEQSEKDHRQVEEGHKTVYIKSTLVGIVTLFAAMIVYIVCATLVFMRRYQPPPGGMIAVSVPAPLNRPWYWLIALAAFAAGFYWEFRRTIG